MVSWESLVFFTGASLLLAATPGPDILYVLTRGLAQGRRAAIAATLGFVCCTMVHTSFAMIGLSALIKASVTGFLILKIVGAIYLIYLGIRMFIDKASFELSNQGKPSEIKRIFLQSFFAGSLNPKVAIFFLAFLPQFISADRGMVWMQFLELGIIFMIVTLIMFTLAGLCAAQIGSILKRNRKIASGMRFGAGSILCSLGIGLVLNDS
ncbi:LysE family translocator [Planctomycetota bacterium]|nr:LysE family translocator [Planctomycetota bacterium]